MSLWELKPDKRARINKIDEIIAPEYIVRLSELGFGIGDEVKCLRHTPFGSPRVYQVGDSVFSIAKDVAAKVVVQVIE